MPLVRLLEGGGASVSGSYQQRGRSGYDLTVAVADEPARARGARDACRWPARRSARAPGFPAGRLVASHFSLMTRETAQVLTGGPALVERALGVKLTKEELGGAQVHLRSGVVDNGAEDEADALAPDPPLPLLPAVERVGAGAGRGLRRPAGPRARRSSLAILPRNARRAYKVRRIVELVVDRGSFFELAPLFGRSQVTGFARLRGQPVGVLANDCMQSGGAMTADGARKLRRFVETCDAFHLPDRQLRRRAGLHDRPRRRARRRRSASAWRRSSPCSRRACPWLAVVLRKSFGVAAGHPLRAGRRR